MHSLLTKEEARRGTDREAEEGGIRGGVRAGEAGQADPQGFSLQSQFQDTAPARQEVALQAGLIGAATGRDYLGAATRTQDVARDGRSDTAPTDMAAGDGDLFAGNRPTQSRVDEAPSYPQPELRRTASRVLSEKATGLGAG